MPFTVTGLCERGPAMFACETMAHALEKAAELVRSGDADVLIADARGAQFTPDPFSRSHDP